MFIRPSKYLQIDNPVLSIDDVRVPRFIKNYISAEHPYVTHVASLSSDRAISISPLSVNIWELAGESIQFKNKKIELTINDCNRIKSFGDNAVHRFLALSPDSRYLSGISEVSGNLWIWLCDLSLGKLTDNMAIQYTVTYNRQYTYNGNNWLGLQIGFLQRIPEITGFHFITPEKIAITHNDDIFGIHFLKIDKKSQLGLHYIVATPYVNSLAYSPDGNRLIAVTNDLRENKYHLYTIKEDSYIGTLPSVHFCKPLFITNDDVIYFQSPNQLVRIRYNKDHFRSMVFASLDMKETGTICQLVITKDGNFRAIGENNFVEYPLPSDMSRQLNQERLINKWAPLLDTRFNKGIVNIITSYAFFAPVAEYNSIFTGKSCLPVELESKMNTLAKKLKLSLKTDQANKKTKTQLQALEELAFLIQVESGKSIRECIQIISDKYPKAVSGFFNELKSLFSEMKKYKNSASLKL